MTPKDTATSKSTPTKSIEPAKAVAAAKPVEPAKAEAPAAPAASDGEKLGEKVILSLSVPEKLARQVRLLAKLEGVTISTLFLSAVEKEIPVRLKAALASIKDEVE